MPAIYEYEHVVEPADIDELGHANNLSYLRWMQAAAVAHSAAQGWPGDAYRQLRAGWVVRSHQIEYLQPAFERDTIVVRTWVAEMKKATSLRRYKIVRVRGRPSGDKETVLAVAATDWVFVDFATGVPRRIPPEVSQAFEIGGEPV